MASRSSRYIHSHAACRGYAPAGCGPCGYVGLDLQWEAFRYRFVSSWVRLRKLLTACDRESGRRIHLFNALDATSVRAIVTAIAGIQEAPIHA